MVARSTQPPVSTPFASHPPMGVRRRGESPGLVPFVYLPSGCRCEGLRTSRPTTSSTHIDDQSRRLELPMRSHLCDQRPGTAGKGDEMALEDAVNTTLHRHLFLALISNCAAQKGMYRRTHPDPEAHFVLSNRGRHSAKPTFHQQRVKVGEFGFITTKLQPICAHVYCGVQNAHNHGKVDVKCYHQLATSV